MQESLPLMGCIDNEMREMPYEQIAYLPTEQAAFRYCLRHSRVYRTQSQVAECLGVHTGDLNCMLNADHNKRPKYMSRVRQIKLQKICGNTAIDQWAKLYTKGLLVCQRSVDQRLAELEEERAQLLAQN
tara:strand:- start:1483 stop:1869 length:387 start_codon:yes stop_codon:yes gene_type:complete